ncbi:MAG: hypothetical protein RLZZ244_756, partial [Verrucomicrobiota bacterium]
MRGVSSSLGVRRLVGGLQRGIFWGACLVAGSAQAHSGGESASGLVSGFVHPLLGADHIVAMVAVGLWGAFL